MSNKLTVKPMKIAAASPKAEKQKKPAKKKDELSQEEAACIIQSRKLEIFEI